MPEIRTALASLPKAQRVAVVYRDVVGLSYGETAEQMGTSVDAVTMLLHRGRQRLRQTLGLTTDGVGLWRWLRQSGTSQVAVVKGTAAVVAAAGLTTAGVATARAVAPIGAHVSTAAATRSGGPTAAIGRASGGGAALESARRHSVTTPDSRASAGRPSREGSPASVHSSSAAAGTSRASAGLSPADPPATSTSLLRVPSVSLPTLPISPSSATVPATVTVSTPVTAVTVTTPTGTTATVATPVTTVTVPIP